MPSTSDKDFERLIILKADLQLTTKSFDAYLVNLLHMAEAFIEREGIVLTDSIEDDSLRVMYAAYLYRKRADPTGAMPRMLRWALNNRKFSKPKEGTVNVTG